MGLADQLALKLIEQTWDLRLWLFLTLGVMLFNSIELLSKVAINLFAFVYLLVVALVSFILFWFFRLVFLECLEDLSDLWLAHQAFISWLHYKECSIAATHSRLLSFVINTVIRKVTGCIVDLMVWNFQLGVFGVNVFSLLLCYFELRRILGITSFCFGLAIQIKYGRISFNADRVIVLLEMNDSSWDYNLIVVHNFVLFAVFAWCTCVAVILELMPIVNSHKLVIWVNFVIEFLSVAVCLAFDQTVSSVIKHVLLSL